MKGLFSDCKVLHIDHLAVTTSAFDATLQDYLSLEGARLLKGPGVNTRQRVRYAFVQLRDGCPVEVLAPEGDSPIARHVQQGGGPYHFCYAVADLEQSTVLAEKGGAKLVVSPVADVAFDGRRVAFLCHEAHGLFELVEAFPQAGNGDPEAGTTVPRAIKDVAPLGAAAEEAELVEGLGRVFSKVLPNIEASALATAAMDESAEWDSLAQIQLVMEIESEFSINIPPEQIERLTTYSAILHYLMPDAS